MNYDSGSSQTTGFERSNGFMPWDHLANVLGALNGLGRAMLVTWQGYYSAVHQNASPTERELIRWHASLLNTCLDVVNDRLRAVESGEPEKKPSPEVIVVE